MPGYGRRPLYRVAMPAAEAYGNSELQQPKRWRFLVLGVSRGAVGWQGTP